MCICVYGGWEGEGGGETGRDVSPCVLIYLCVYIFLLPVVYFSSIND